MVRTSLLSGFILRYIPLFSFTVYWTPPYFGSTYFIFHFLAFQELLVVDNFVILLREYSIHVYFPLLRAGDRWTYSTEFMWQILSDGRVRSEASNVALVGKERKTNQVEMNIQYDSIDRTIPIYCCGNDCLLCFTRFRRQTSWMRIGWLRDDEIEWELYKLHWYIELKLTKLKLHLHLWNSES